MSTVTLATRTVEIVGVRASKNVPATLGEFVARDPLWFLKFRDFGPSALKKVVAAIREVFGDCTPAPWQPAPFHAPRTRREILGIRVEFTPAGRMDGCAFFSKPTLEAHMRATDDVALELPDNRLVEIGAAGEVTIRFPKTPTPQPVTPSLS